MKGIEYHKYRGQAALHSLPQEMQKYFMVHYRVDTPDLEFAGLVCRSCNHWIEFGHERWCPVGDMFPEENWKQLAENSEKLVGI